MSCLSPFPQTSAFQDVYKPSIFLDDPMEDIPTPIDTDCPSFKQPLDSPIQLAQENFYIDGDPLGAFPLKEAVEAGNTDLIARNLKNPSVADLGKAVIEAAGQSDPELLSLVLTCESIHLIRPEDLGKALHMAWSETALELLLSLKAAHFIPEQFLCYPLQRAFALDYTRVLTLILELECVKKVCSQLGKVKIPVKLTDFSKMTYFNSPFSNELIKTYFAARKSNRPDLAAKIRPETAVELTGKELIRLCKSDQYLRINFIPGLYTLPTYYFAGVLRISVKYDKPNTSLFLLDVLELMRLSDLDHLIIQRTFWHVINKKNTAQIEIFKKSKLIQALISSEELKYAEELSTKKSAEAALAVYLEIKKLGDENMEAGIHFYDLEFLSV